MRRLAFNLKTMKCRPGMLSHGFPPTYKCGTCGQEWITSVQTPECFGHRIPGTVRVDQFDQLMNILDCMHYEDEDGNIWPLETNVDLKADLVRDILRVVDKPS